MEPTLKKKGRPPGKKSVEKPDPTVHLAPEVHRLLTVHAKKLKLKNSEYANAAIAYFAENGLDPTKAATQSFAHVTKTVAQEARSIRVQNVDIGNRLISILRNWEKGLYGFLQQQQGGSLTYLEQSVVQILRHQVALETNLLSPMVEMLVRTNLEAYTGRVIGERTNLFVTGKKDSEWPAANKAVNDDRDQKVVVQMREFIKNHNVPAPSLPTKPQVPATPPKAPATSAATTPAAGTDPK
ncbi:hypothetical protein [Hymenobacter canadensis]|uniref:Uncharacterized protein n=1 Tax=Hymenobacter canadensis TaxID=2999067 RepID=A0ABY7LWQ6_9BACT|nr:hypothetical protein [Hymenobacter canadensis]WBA44034.1 hypothetical protein O3303_20955 [Hymenobacter canadensis]